MRKQKTFIATHSLGDTNSHYPTQKDSFDWAVEQWIAKNIQPGSEVVRHLNTTCLAGNSGFGQWPTLVVTLLIEYTPKEETEADVMKTDHPQDE